MGLLQKSFDHDYHPLDVIESVSNRNEWDFERTGDNEIAIVVTGRWTQYTISYSWMEDCEALHVACAFDMKIAPGRVSEVLKLTAMVNQQLLLGHFDFWRRDSLIIFRQSLILPDCIEPTDRQIEFLLSTAVGACEAYYAAFQFVVWSGQTAKTALDTVLFETVGNA
jgi:hypothetical protein